MGSRAYYQRLRRELTDGKLLRIRRALWRPYHNPLPIVLTRGKGVHVWDTQGKKYLDMMSAYSAVSHGHCHPRLVKVLKQQAQRLAVVSRAYYSNQLGPF